MKHRLLFRALLVAVVVLALMSILQTIAINDLNERMEKIEYKVNSAGAQE